MSRPFIEAAYPGVCGACDEHYDVGTVIQPGVGGWTHMSCPDSLAVTAAACERCWQIPAASGDCGCER